MNIPCLVVFAAIFTSTISAQEDTCYDEGLLNDTIAACVKNNTERGGGPGRGGPPPGNGPHGQGPPPGEGPHGKGPPPGKGPHGKGPPPGKGPHGKGPPPGKGPHGQGPPQGEGRRGKGPPPGNDAKGRPPPQGHRGPPPPPGGQCEMDAKTGVKDPGQPMDVAAMKERLTKVVKEDKRNEVNAAVDKCEQQVSSTTEQGEKMGMYADCFSAELERICGKGLPPRPPGPPGPPGPTTDKP